MIDPKVARLATEGGLNEIQRGYVLELLAADAKGEAGTFGILGASRKVADCLSVVLPEDASKPIESRRLPDWDAAEIPERVVRPAAAAGIEMVRQIGAAAALGQPFYKFAGGLDVTRSTLSQTRRYTRELLEAHPLPRADGDEDPVQLLERLFGEASPRLEALQEKAQEEQRLRWAALGPGRRP